MDTTGTLKRPADYKRILCEISTILIYYFAVLITMNVFTFSVSFSIKCQGIWEMVLFSRYQGNTILSMVAERELCYLNFFIGYV